MTLNMDKRQISPRVLPDVLSDLIEVAVTDLEKVEASRRYRVNMGVWHSAGCSPHARCEVCLAGGVIAFTLGSDPAKDIIPYNFDNATRDKLTALDCVRVGNISGALNTMKVKGPREYRRWPLVPGYANNSDAFKRALRKVAVALREHGL